MECQYPDCKAEAQFSFGMADPDAELDYYCGGHIDIVKERTMIELFTRDGRCKAKCVDGSSCFNSKRFGDYCGIHHKSKNKKGVKK